MTKPTHNLSPATLRQRRSRARRGAPIFCCLRCSASGTTLARDPHDRLLCAACGHELAAASCVRCRDCNTFTPIAECAPNVLRCRPCHKARQRAAQRAYRARRSLNTAPLSETGLVAAVDHTPTTSEPISKGINETNEPNNLNDGQSGRRSDDDAQAGEPPEPAPGGETNDLLIDQARALKDRLETAFWACYQEHPYLGDIPISALNSRRMRLKRIIQRANRRVNRRLARAGYPIPISRAFAMWVINDVYKPGK